MAAPFNSGSTGKSRSILIVEDEKLVSWSLSRALEKAGYRVSVAESGEGARQQLSNRNFDLVITDVQLPSSSGLEVAAEIDPAVPLIVISASQNVRPPVAGPKVCACVEKPFDLDEVTNLVGKLLSRRA